MPIARPGYDERWDTSEHRKTNRYLPRDTEWFQQLLDLADEYRPTSRIFVPFDDWIEGHTIEPGTFTGLSLERSIWRSSSSSSNQTINEFREGQVQVD